MNGWIGLLREMVEWPDPFTDYSLEGDLGLQLVILEEFRQAVKLGRPPVN